MLLCHDIMTLIIKESIEISCYRFHWNQTQNEIMKFHQHSKIDCK